MGSTKELPTASDETDTQKRARIRLELASAYYSQGQMSTALDEVKQALAIDPNLPHAYNLRGLIYSGMNEYQLAEDSFRRALQMDPHDADVMHNYGWFLCQRRRFPESYAQLDKAVSIPQYRGVDKTLTAKGVCQARSGDMVEAEKTLTRAYQFEPGNPVVAMNLALVLYRKGEYERARFYVRRVNADPELANAESLWLAARIEQKMGNRTGAMEYGDQLKRRYPRSREASAFEQGRFDE
jgi:type IV pilus assembly protein PilF